MTSSIWFPAGALQDLASRDSDAHGSWSVASHAELTVAIASGDRDAFACFYDAWFDRVLATARRLTRGNDADSLDVVHDVMLKVARSMVALGDQRAVDAWMARTILTTVLDRRRVQRRRSARETVVATPADACANGEGTMLDALLHDERIAWVRAEIVTLPEHERQALRARFEGGHTLAEVGTLLGISGHAAHGRIRRALERLTRRAREVFGHA